MFNKEVSRPPGGLRTVCCGAWIGMLLAIPAAWLGGLLLVLHPVATTGGGSNVVETAGMVLAGATAFFLFGAPAAAGFGIVYGAVVAALALVSPVVVTYLPVGVAVTAVLFGLPLPGEAAPTLLGVAAWAVGGAVAVLHAVLLRRWIRRQTPVPALGGAA